MYSRSWQEGSNTMPNQMIVKAPRAQKKNKKGNASRSIAGPSRIIEMDAPVAKSYKIMTGRPSVKGSGQSVRVRHRELVVPTIAGTSSFAVANSLSLNPGLSGVFPWLSTIAANWEQFCFHGLKAEYIPIAPSSTQGDILLSPDYDASDPAPTTEQQAANNKDSVMDSCWKRLVLVFNKQSMMALGPRRFVRQSAVAGDIKTFDVGKLFVCSNNASGSPTFGKLFLEYDVEFFIPQSSPNTDTAPLSTSLFTRATNQSFTSGVAAPIQYATSNFDPLSIGPAAAGVFTPPAGCYKISTSVSAADNANEVFIAQLSLFKNGAALSNAVGMETISAGSADGAISCLSLEGILPMNGSDTFQVQCTLTGNAGALDIQAGLAQLVISLA